MVLVTERFVGLARAVKIGEGVPDQPSLNIPGNPEFYGEAELAGTVAALADELVGLIAPEVRKQAATVGGN